jgi:uncharacterized iron-regulated membrane protein
MWPPLLRKTHRWFGLLIALPVAVQGLTGCILLLAELAPDQQATLAPSSSAGARSVGEIVAAAQDWAGARATRYVAPRSEGSAARVEIAATPNKPLFLRIDPATLEVLGVDPSTGGALGWLRALHVQFLTPDFGRRVGGWVGIGLLAMLLTGIPIWWPRSPPISCWNAPKLWDGLKGLE